MIDEVIERWAGEPQAARGGHLAPAPLDAPPVAPGAPGAEPDRDPVDDSRRLVDVQLTGTAYVDIVFANLSAPPSPGTEVKTTSLGMSPGGVANLAVALRRLGLSVRLDAAFATDTYGEYVWRTLSEEGVDLSGSIRFAEWSTPLTVSIVYGSDRSMITYERPQPAPVETFLDPAIPPAHAILATLGADGPAWLPRIHAAGTRIFADLGWDATERWDDADLAGLAHVDAFMPNCVEAMAYTRTDSPEAAAGRLVERVPLVVVKCGSDGSICWRAGDPAPVREPAIDVQAIDPTGAGDVFDAAFIFGNLAGWNVKEALRFGNLCAGLSVQHYGGSLSAPSWDEVAAWIRRQPDGVARYGFLDSYIGRVSERASPQRAHPTL